MGWLQVIVAIPVALMAIALIHDFFAGLGEERLWSDPALDDADSLRNRAAAAEAAHRSRGTAIPIQTGTAQTGTAHLVSRRVVNL